MGKKQRLIVGMSGASGAPLTVELLRQLSLCPEVETHLVATRGAELTLRQECGMTLDDLKQLAKSPAACVRPAGLLSFSGFFGDGSNTRRRCQTAAPPRSAQLSPL